MPLFVARFPPYILKDHASPKRPRLCTQGTQTELSYCTVAEVLKVTDVTAQVTACIDAGTCGEGSIEMRTGDVITGGEGFKKAGDAADATEAAVSPTETEPSDHETDDQPRDRWLTLWPSTFDAEEGRFTTAYVELND